MFFMSSEHKPKLLILTQFVNKTPEIVYFYCVKASSSFIHYDKIFVWQDTIDSSIESIIQHSQNWSIFQI